jgi:hypothetical protein
MPDPTPHSRSPRSVVARIAAIATGALVTLLAIGFLTAGGVLLWASAQKDDQGYIATASQRFSTDTAAIATENLDVNIDAPDVLVDPDRYGTVRLKVTPNADAPVFVGIARTRDVAAYLDQTRHALVEDLSFTPFSVRYRTHAGDQRSAPPTAQRFWAASAHGTGTQTLTWDVRDGSWSVVVMNADGSPGVDAKVSAGARVPLLAGIGWGAIGGGVVLLIVAGGLLVLGVRTPRRRAGAPPTPDRTAVAA